MSIVHATARLCRAAPFEALALLSEASGMARWNLGLRNPRELGGGLFASESNINGKTGYVRVSIDAARGGVHYGVGAAPDALAPRIQAHVQAGEEFGHPAGTCVVTLLAWRTAQMDDARWQQLQATHEVEVDLIRAELEAGSGRADCA